MDPTSILYLINALGYGGAEIQVSRLARGMKNRGHDVTVVTLIPPVALADELRADGIAVETLGMRAGRPNPLGMLRLIRILRERAPTVVHSHIVHANLLARLARPLTRVPVLICSAHSVNEGRRWLELAYRYTDRLTDLTTNVSQAAVDRYVRVGAAPARRIRFMPNGLDVLAYRHDDAARTATRAELGLRDDQFAWLAVGRFTPAKDYPNMLRAFARLRAQHGATSAVLVLVGRGSLEEQVRADVTALGLEGHVKFLGLRADVPAVMSAADAYVMSSAWEGMPLVLQEASAACLPLVATEVGGTAEVVDRDRSGLLVPPHDPEMLAAAMGRVMSMTTRERDDMGRAGLEFVTARFDLDGVLDSWEGLYEELLVRKLSSALAGSAAGNATGVAVRAGIASVAMLKDVGGA
jgi:glycosyltransferase involved in cell wall biosynthesis